MPSLETIGLRLQPPLNYRYQRRCGLVFVAASLFAHVAYGQAESESPTSQLEQMDARFQEAVRTNDAPALETILADDFLLTTGSGRTFSKADLLSEARSGRFIYSMNETKKRRVTVRGDVGVVTGLLSIKGTDAGRPFDVQLWFTDIYVHQSGGWKNWLDQASRPVETPVADINRTSRSP